VIEICESAGVSKGAFYHHFPSKQGLFLCLLEAWLEGIDQRLAAIRSTQTAMAQALVHMAAASGSIFAEAGGRLPMFLEFWSQAHREPAVWAASIAPYRRYRMYFARLIEEGISDGSLSPIDSQIAARLIVALAVGLLLQSVLEPEGEDWPKLAGEAVRLVVSGMQADRG
jgi:AcrR family transcriptional regulator